MQIGQAREVARRWVAEEGATLPGFAGAYFAGSANWLPEDAELPAASDLDINLVFAGSEAPSKRTKFVHGGVLLEVTYLPADLLRTPEAVLGHYHLAGGMATAGIILDPLGNLAPLQAEVRAGYARRRWVTARCRHALDRVTAGLDSLQESDAVASQATTCLFSAGITTHVLLVAGLRNPTVRKRYVAVHDLLAERGMLAELEPLLELLGSATMSRGRALEHLATLAAAYDAAAAVMRSPFPFASDISPLTRPIAIDGPREMIEQGYHREAAFWLGASHCRCQQVLSSDAPAEMVAQHAAGFAALLADLGLATYADRQHRCEQVRAYLPHLWQIAEAIMAATPAIEE